MQLAIFIVSEREYAVDVSQISEVIRFRQITPICDVPDYVEGVITLRDNVFPVVNLRKRFGTNVEESTKFNRIIISKINERTVGFIVDFVSDVITIQDSDVESPDELLQDSRYLVGIIKTKQRLIMILDINKLLVKDSVLQLCEQKN